MNIIIKPITDIIFSPTVILLVLAMLVLSRMIQFRHVLMTLIAFMVYVTLIPQIQETDLLSEYEGIQFILDLPLNFFEWVGNSFQSLLSSPESTAIDISASIEDLLNSGSFKDFFNNFLGKLYGLFQEIFEVIPESCASTARTSQRLICEVPLLK